MSYGKRICLQCGKEFEAAYISQLCCSPECQKRRRQNRKNAWAKHYRASRSDILERLQESLASAQKEAADSTEALTAVTLMYRAEQRRLQAAVKDIALRRRFLKKRNMELVAEEIEYGTCYIACARLRAAVKKLALRKHFLNGRCKELMEQVVKQGEEINVLRGRLERQEIPRGKKAKKKTVKEPAVIPQDEMDAILRGETREKTQKAKLKDAYERVRSEMQVCERLSCAALHLPCGQREECFMPRCERVPDGVEWKDKGGAS